MLSEVACDIANDFETGVGADMRAYLNFLAGGTAVLATEEGEEAEATIRVTTHEGEASGASIDIVAAPNSTFSIALSLDSDADAPAFMGSTMRVFAGAGARVDITVYLTASDAVTCVEDSGLFDARVSVRHVVLGGGFTATGLAADLRGDRSRIDVDTSYLASGTQQRDFNYIIRHRGRKTVSNMDANGVLTGTSKKCLRGTIDLIHGQRAPRVTSARLCCWRARAWTTKPSRTSCAMRTTSRATTEQPSATCVPISSSTRHAAASPRSRPRPCSFPQSSRTPCCRRPMTPCAPTSCASATGTIPHFEEEIARLDTENVTCDTCTAPSEFVFNASDEVSRGWPRVDIELNPFKGDFPLLAQHPELAFLDSGATAQRPACVLEAQKTFYETMNANPLRGLYSLSVEATEAIAKVRSQIAELIGAVDERGRARANEVVFCRNTSEALNIVAKGFAPHVLEPGDEVAISIMEHHSNLIPWQQVCRETGAKLVYLYPNPTGQITDDESPPRSARDQDRSCGHVSNVLGVENPIAKLAAGRSR